jgi:hypothetical protein
MKGWRFYNTTDINKNATEELKRLSQNARNVSNTFRVAGRSLWFQKGTILREM